MVRVLEQLDVLLQVLQIELLLSLEEQRLVGLGGFEARRLFLKSQDGRLSEVHARVQLLDLAVVAVEAALVLNLHVLKALAVVSQPLRVLDNRLVAVVDLLDEVV